MKRHVQELQNVFAYLTSIVDNPNIRWEDKYSQVFSSAGKHRMDTLFEVLNIGSLQYYDPDTSYEEDVLSYFNALKSRMEEIAPMLDSLATANLPDTKIEQWMALYFTDIEVPLIAVSDTRDEAIQALKRGSVKELNDLNIQVTPFYKNEAFRLPDA